MDLSIVKVPGTLRTREEIQGSMFAKEGTVLERFAREALAAEFLRGQTLQAVVEVEKGRSRRHLVREAPADASREPQKGKRGTERIVAMFREKKDAKAHAKKLDREAAAKPSEPEDGSEELRDRAEPVPR